MKPAQIQSVYIFHLTISVIVHFSLLLNIYLNPQFTPEFKYGGIAYNSILIGASILYYLYCYISLFKKRKKLLREEMDQNSNQNGNAEQKSESRPSILQIIIAYWYLPLFLFLKEYVFGLWI